VATVPITRPGTRRWPPDVDADRDDDERYSITLRKQVRFFGADTPREHPGSGKNSYESPGGVAVYSRRPEITVCKRSTVSRVGRKLVWCRSLEGTNPVISPEWILKEWERRWQPLAPDQRVSFLRRSELKDLSRLPAPVVAHAINLEHKLDRILQAARMSNRANRVSSPSRISPTTAASRVPRPRKTWWMPGPPVEYKGNSLLAPPSPKPIKKARRPSPPPCSACGRRPNVAGLCNCS